MCAKLLAFTSGPVPFLWEAFVSHRFSASARNGIIVMCHYLLH